MLVHVITHGEHHKGGSKAASYDGPLTAKGRDQVRSIKRQIDYNRAFCGNGQRHRETVQILATAGTIPIASATMTIPRCGNDVDMFALYHSNQVACMHFWDFILSQKDEDFRGIMIITSNMYLWMIPYFLGGGEKKFGHFSQTAVAIATGHTDDIPWWQERYRQEGALFTFEV